MNRRRLTSLAFLLVVLLAGLVWPAAAQSTPLPQPSATVTAIKLNVRSLPDPSAAILTKINQDEIYRIVGQNALETWWQIDVNGMIGWVNGTYVDAQNIAGVPTTWVDETETPSSTAEATAVPVAGCSGDDLFFAASVDDLCATGPAMHVQAAIQQFENGTMIWLAISGDVYVLSNRGATLVKDEIFANLPLPEALTAPEGRLAPDDRFGRVWANIAGMRGDLGWATSSVSDYVSIVQPGQLSLTMQAVTLLMLRDSSVIAVDPDTSMWYTVQ